MKSELVKDQRNVLALCGLAPAVVTEALWDLLRAKVEIATVHIVTTQEGARRFKEKLEGTNGAIARLWQLWASGRDLPKIHLHVIDCVDMVREEDHWKMADQIGRLVHDLTREGQLPLQACAAGGRKTMSILLALAMSLYARPQDRLVHILTDPTYEANPLFFFPDPHEEASIHPIDIPFPRLARLIPEGSTQNLTKLVQMLDDRLKNTELLSIIPHQCQLKLREHNVRLPPRLMAVYLMFVHHRQGSNEGFSLNNPDISLLLMCCKATNMSPEISQSLATRLTQEDPKPWFLEQISRLRSLFSEQLGHVLAQEIGIEKLGKAPNTFYRLRLAPWQISI